MPRQYDVFANPVPQARRAFPLVAVLQSDLTATGRDRIVAPLAVRKSMLPIAGRLTPAARIGSEDYAVLVPLLAVVSAQDLRDAIGTVAPFRDVIASALDLLFFGV